MSYQNNEINEARNAEYSQYNTLINSPEYKQDLYNQTYGKKADQLAAREDARLASDLRMKEQGGSARDLQRDSLDTQKYTVDATTGAQKYVADLGLQGTQYSADTQKTIAQGQQGVDKYGIDKTYEMGTKQLTETGRQFDVGMQDKSTQRQWQSGENRADRQLSSSLAGFQATLSMLQAPRYFSGGGAQNTYWR